MTRSQDEMARLAQYITETSAHDARGERMAHYAELRSGRMYHGEEREPMARADWWIIVVCAAIAGALIGGMTMPDVPIPSEGFGHEYCKGKC
ncbi:MAG: hypothetical protein Tp118SUR00d2C21406231_41 [Prokaryotic dsDNA virus sp.]|nr:MAG: hypothetical protein Tp125DCM00d2C40298531_60 [Prokaryotic dsDNA virus sp.]QDP53161.1 MAG: hypothetical protein Tp118SUR00d2C21406231_41 [Prokaryotic dsDNA virus sp.]|tara:strand:- start:25255 stop:25530 length:276 start_codon:yes stop_codon:yes gene_type:complete